MNVPVPGDYFTLRVPPIHANDTGSTRDDTIGSQNDTAVLVPGTT